MRPIETIPGMGGGGIKENDGEVEFNYDILQELLLKSQCTSRKKTKNKNNAPPAQQ
jgi:hypothetical protein